MTLRKILPPSVMTHTPESIGKTVDKSQTPPVVTDDTFTKHGFCVLSSLRKSAEITVCTDPTAMVSLLEQAETKIAVLYRPPVHALGSLLSDSASTADATSCWTQTLITLLQVQRKQRRRMSFVEVPDRNMPSLTKKAALAEALSSSEWLDVPNWPARVHSYEPLAALLLDLHIETRELIEELEAATRGGLHEKSDKTLILESLFTESRVKITAERQAQETIRQLDDEKLLCNRLQEQVIDLQNTLIELDRDYQTSLSEKRRVEHARDQLEAERQRVEDARQQLEAEHHRRVDELTYELQSVYLSTSWRMTGPARAIVTRFRR